MSTARRRDHAAALDRNTPYVETDEDTTAPDQELPPDPFDALYLGSEEFEPDVDAAPADTTQTGADEETEIEPETTVPATRPDNPWADKVQAIPSKWGTSIHERANFAPTMKTDYHGVWGTRNLSEVRNWVSTARDSINADDNFVVAAKPGNDGGYDFLVDMNGQTVGYISGRKVARGAKPKATHLAVHVNNKGYVVTASPCTPEIF